MSRIPTKDIPERAEHADFAEARGLHADWQHELTSPQISNDRALALDDGLDTLEARHPELQDSPIESAEKRSQKNAKRRAKRAAGTHPRRPSAAGKRGPSRSRPRSGGRGGRTFKRTGVPAAAAGATDTLLKIAGATIGLAVLFTVVRNAKSVEDLAGFAQHGLHRFIAPVDPLGGGHQLGQPASVDPSVFDFAAAAASSPVFGPRHPGHRRQPVHH